MSDLNKNLSKTADIISIFNRDTMQGIVGATTLTKVPSQSGSVHKHVHCIVIVSCISL